MDGSDAEDSVDSTLQLEEHYLYSLGPADRGRSSHIFLKQAYTYWRYGLNGPHGPLGRGALDARSVRVDSFRYDSKDALEAAIRARALAPGAMVFLSVTTMAVDTDLRDFDALRRAPYFLGEDRVLDTTTSSDSLASRTLDPLCVYTHTPDILLRASLLRDLLAYPEPLVLVLAGDSACRLKSLPPTHHAIVFPNDGAPVSSSSSSSKNGADDSPIWFPEGLEGLEEPEDWLFWRPEAAERAEAATEEAARDDDDASRSYLLDAALSVNGRKPSREALVRYLEEQGGEAALEALAKDANLAIRFNASVVDEPQQVDDNAGVPHPSPRARRAQFSFVPTTPQGSTDSFDSNRTAGERGAYFALAPAGDTWSSGRVLEAMLSGMIPVVDATYQTDGNASAKGCDDPARFWRDGAPAWFPRGAPFVFVTEWTQLPDLLRAAGALNRTALAERLRAVDAYRTAFETALRDAVLDAVLARSSSIGVEVDDDDVDDTEAPAVTNEHAQKYNRTTCWTTPLADEEYRAQLDAEFAYYSSDWVAAFADTPDLPTGGCTTTFRTHRPSSGGPPVVMPHGHAQCYAAACAPPKVHAFECGPLEEQRATPQQPR